MADATTAIDSSRKVRRLQNACDECRRRKTKCDSAKQPGGVCSGCLSLGVRCTHNAGRKKRGPKAGAPSNATVKSIVTALLSESPAQAYVIPEDQEAIREVLIELAKYIQHLEKEVARTRRRETLAELAPATDKVDDFGSGASPQSVESGDHDEIDVEYHSETEALSEQVSSLHVSRMRNRYFGKSSAAMFLMKALAIKKSPDVTRRREFWGPLPWEHQEVPAHASCRERLFYFPDSDHLRELIDTYFTHHHPYYPLLHRSTFERLVSEGFHLRDHHFGSLVLGLCSVASRYTTDSRNLPENPCSTLGLGWRWFRQLNLSRNSFTEPVTLHELQAYCLTISFLEKTNLTDSGWILIALAIRFCQERGIHRRKGRGHKPTLERELWKRAWWYLFSLDTIMSYCFGRPRATILDEFDVEPLIECDDEEWDKPDVDPFVLASTKNAKNPIGFFNCWISLLQIVAFCQRALYSVRRSELTRQTMGVTDAEWSERAVMWMDENLKEWLDTIPEHLKWDPQCENKTYLGQAVVLYSTYYWVQIQAHRLFIPRPGEEGALHFNSLAICANSARSCIRVIGVHYRNQYHPNLALQITLFTSATVLLLNIFRGKELKIQFDPRKEMLDVFKCLEILLEWEKTVVVAGRYSDILNAFAGIRLPPVLVEPSTEIPVESSSETIQQAKSSQALRDELVVNASQDLASSGFCLPLSSTELGQLPVHGSFDSFDVNMNFDHWQAYGQLINDASTSNQSWNWGMNASAGVSEGAGSTQAGAWGNTSAAKPTVFDGSWQPQSQAEVDQLQTIFGAIPVPDDELSAPGIATQQSSNWDPLNFGIDPLFQWYSGYTG